MIQILSGASLTLLSFGSISGQVSSRHRKVAACSHRGHLLTNPGSRSTCLFASNGSSQSHCGQLLGLFGFSLGFSPVLKLEGHEYSDHRHLEWRRVISLGEEEEVDSG